MPECPVAPARRSGGLMYFEALFETAAHCPTWLLLPGSVYLQSLLKTPHRKKTGAVHQRTNSLLLKNIINHSLQACKMSNTCGFFLSFYVQTNAYSRLLPPHTDTTDEESQEVNQGKLAVPNLHFTAQTFNKNRFKEKFQNVCRKIIWKFLSISKFSLSADKGIQLILTDESSTFFIMFHSNTWKQNISQLNHTFIYTHTHTPSE